MAAWWTAPPPRPDADTGAAAAGRWDRLTKPPGSLGRLEHAVTRLATQQGRLTPTIERVHIAIFAGDHGVAQRGVSAYPQVVTSQMLANFAGGGAAIAVLARQLGAALTIVDVGSVHAEHPLPRVLDRRVARGTADFTQAPAMTAAQAEAALSVGAACVAAARAAGADLFIGGEMGIGNTTAAAALGCALLAAPPEALLGPGTGVDAAGLARKRHALALALARHGATPQTPFEILRSLGGLELAALAGAYVAAAQARLPALVDGFIATAAALVAARLNPGVIEWLHFAHRSAEPGHARLLDALGGCALLDLDLRLGEGSGAALAVPLLRAACALHAEMATFDGAGVSTTAI
jgi:nicotinate-nucleotide--dimethylbenzimidazole phosphoribosyltransferase